MRKILNTAAILLLFGAPAALLADSVQTIAPFIGSFHPTTPFPTYTVGTFNILPGGTSATISGTFGNLIPPSSGGFPDTAGVDLFLGSILVAQCVGNVANACYSSLTTPTPFSDTLTAAQLASLGTGPVNFTAVQTSGSFVQLGTTTFDEVIGTSPVPEPSTILMCCTGLLGLAGAVKRRVMA